MSFADDIKDTSDLQVDPNLKVITYGKPGVGKTTLAETLPGKSFVVAIEPGIQSLSHVSVKYGEAENMDEIREAYNFLKQHEGSLDSVLIDSATELAEKALLEFKKECDHGQRAYGEMQTFVKRMFKNFIQLDMTVVFTAKEQRETIDNSLLYCPHFPGKTLTQKSQIGHDPDYVLPLRMKKDAEGNMRRVLQTEPDGQYVAKKRDPNQALNKFEKPDIGALKQKIVNSYSEEE